MKDRILAFLPDDYPWKDRFQFFESIDSTNTQLKLLARTGIPHGTVFAADQQTGGRGRLGRSFLSPAGVGMYLSILLRPQCRPEDIMHLTCAAAKAMSDAIEKAAGIRPGIKWTNDLVYNKKKLSGILTEIGLDQNGKLDYAIVGIGVNCCQSEQDFPPEIRKMAGSLEMVTGNKIDRAKVAAAMMEALWEMDRMLLSGKDVIMNRYRQDCITVGQDISLVRGDETRYGTAIDVDSEGALVVTFSDGHTEHVTSGEISIRGMYGYV